MLQIYPYTKRIVLNGENLALTLLERDFLIALTSAGGYIAKSSKAYEELLEYLGDIEAVFSRLQRHLHPLTRESGPFLLRRGGFSMVGNYEVISQDKRVLNFSTGNPKDAKARGLLTPLEEKILLVMAKPGNIGETSQGLARILELRTGTVGTYLRNIYRKLEITSKTEAVLFAYRAFPEELSIEGGK